jgi:hypothetical protein
MRRSFSKSTGIDRAVPPDPSPRELAVPKARPSELMSDGWPATGLLRIDQIIGVGRLPISKSQFWALVRERGLNAVKVSPRVTCFYVHELREKLLGSLAPHTPSPTAPLSSSHVKPAGDGVRSS